MLRWLHSLTRPPAPDEVYIQQGAASSVLGNCLDAAGTSGTRGLGWLVGALAGGTTMNYKSTSFCNELALFSSCYFFRALRSRALRNV